MLETLQKVATEITELTEKSPKLPELLKRRREIHRKAIMGMVTPARHEDSKTEKLLDGIVVFEELLREVFEVWTTKEEVNEIVDSFNGSFSKGESCALESPYDNPWLYLLR